MSNVFLAGLLAGYGVAIPVGAIAVLIVSLTARTSLAVGTGAALGVATADGIYALVAVLGGAALVTALVSGAVIVVLAVYLVFEGSPGGRHSPDKAVGQ